MATKKSSLSAGRIIKAILSDSDDVKDYTTRIIPVVDDSAQLPYIRYRRAAVEPIVQKTGFPGADMVQMEVDCCSGSYDDGVELAEAVRSALEYNQSDYYGLRLRVCYLSNSEEISENGVFIQRLIFNMKI